MSDPKPYVDHENKQILYLTEEEASERDDLEPVELDNSKKPRKKKARKKK